MPAASNSFDRNTLQRGPSACRIGFFGVLQFVKLPAKPRSYPLPMEFYRVSPWRSIATLCVVIVLNVSFAVAQTGFSPDDIVAVIDDKEYTAKQMDMIRKSLPPQFRQGTQAMDNQAFIRVYAELLAFAKNAQAEGVTEKEPYRTQLEFARLNFLGQIYLAELQKRVRFKEEEFQKYYEDHRPEYEERHVYAIYIDYSDDPGGASGSDGNKPLSEDEARTTVESLREELSGGADFSELAKQHSSDASAEKGGDLGFFKYTASIPRMLRDAIFVLPVDEVSAALQEGSRFYLFKVTEVRTQPLKAVRNQIATPLQSAKLKQLVDDVRATVKVEYRNAEYMIRSPAAGRPRGFTQEFQIPGPKK